MPKSRKTKQKHQDFQKVKLKVGKKLPKGANETTTAFQSRSILVKEQLKGTDSEQPTTKRKLNLTELFGQCRHYSAGVRHDAVMGIKELITTNPSVLHSSMAAILERMSEFFLDKDQNVRQAVVKTLKVIFPFITSDQISPFFGVISAHLCCAMTHIFEDIQLDSLSVLDLFLEHYPVLVTSSSNQLLQNFIEQISRKSHGKDGKSNDKARSLLVNPNSKLSSQKWRIKVLGRLHRFLYALMQSANADVHTAPQKTTTYCKNGSQTNTLSYDSLATNYLEGFKIRKNQAPGKGQLDIMNDPEQLKSFVQVLIPLLIECWIECGPSQLATSLPGNALGIDTMTTLASILNVVQLLLQYVDQISGDSQEVNIQWIKDNYMKDFLHYFLPYFPYSMHEVQPRGKQKKIEMPQVSVLSLNLSLCEIMSFFMVPFDASEEDVLEMRGDWEDKIMQYISSDVCQAKLSTEQVETTLRVMKHIVNSFKDEETVEKMLSSLHHLLERRHPSSKESQVIHQFLAGLAFLEEGHFYCSLKIMKKWLGTLPTVLLKLTQSKDTVLQHLRIMQRAGSQQEPTYLEALHKSLPSILDVQAINGFPQDVQVQVVEMMYWSPVIGSEVFQQMANLINTQVLDIHAARYFLEIMHSKYSRDVNRQQITPGNYLKFLFTVLIGYRQDDLQSLQNEEDSVLKHKILDIKSSPTKWRNRQIIVENILKSLKKFENDSQIETVVQSTIQQIVGKVSCIPIDTVYSFTQALLMKSLMQDGKFNQKSQKLLAQLMVACLFWCTKENATQMTVEVTNSDNTDTTDDFTTRNIIKTDLYNALVTLLSESQWLFRETLTCVQKMVSADGLDMETLALLLKNLLLEKAVRDRFYEESTKLEQTKALMLNCQPQIETQQWFVNFDYEVTLITRREEDMQAQ